MSDDLDEFMEIVGKEKVPHYHFYYFKPEGYPPALECIRIDDHEPKADHLSWPVIWTKDAEASQEEITQNLEKIVAELKEGKAIKFDHTRKEFSWLRNGDKGKKLRREAAARKKIREAPQKILLRHH